MKTLKKHGLTLALLSVSLIAFGQSLYISAKAEVAQWLLADAWQETLTTGQSTKPWDWADTFPVAQLHVPAHDIKQFVLSGASGRSLAFGPGHLLSSSAPEHGGHVIIGGHRDTHFEFLQDVQVGETVELTDNNNQLHRYAIVSIEIHDSRTDRISDRGQGHLSLVTCYPFNTLQTGGPLRYVVHAQRL